MFAEIFRQVALKILSTPDYLAQACLPAPSAIRPALCYTARVVVVILSAIGLTRAAIRCPWLAWICPARSGMDAGRQILPAAGYPKPRLRHPAMAELLQIGDEMARINTGICSRAAWRGMPPILRPERQA